MTREKLQKGLREAAESARRTREAFGLSNPKTPVEETPAGQLLHALIRATWNHAIDEMRKEGPLGAAPFEMIGCPQCWGSGKYPFTSKACYVCGGDGRTNR